MYKVGTFSMFFKILNFGSGLSHTLPWLTKEDNLLAVYTMRTYSVKKQNQNVKTLYHKNQSMKDPILAYRKILAT